MPDFSLLAGSNASESAVNAAASAGISVTGSASIHTKGSWTQLLAASAVATGWLSVSILPSTASTRVLVDIGIGASTAEKILVPDLYAESPAANQQQTRAYLIPTVIPAGTRLSARLQGLVASSVALVSLILIPTPLMWSPGIGVVESAGIDASTTRLTAVDPGGTSQTDGAWVQLLAATARPFRWLCVSQGHGASATGPAANWMMDIGIGAAAAEKVLVPDLCFSNATGVDAPVAVWGFPCSVPAGSRLSARTRCSVTTATDRIIDIGVWGVA